MVFQPIVDIAEICALKGADQIILSPGSRCAPLTLAFARHSKLNVRTIPDERSAGFIALGMAQYFENPTVLCCTSGTAVLNYAPAVTEAYYQNVPLLILTADRPPELIDQQDGQAIHQDGIYEPHVKKSFQLPDDLQHSDAWDFTVKTVSNAIDLVSEYPKGPVHINIPFREPFYPEKNEVFQYSTGITLKENKPEALQISDEEWSSLQEEWVDSNRILILAGQQPIMKEVLQNINAVSSQIPIIGDILSNMHSVPEIINGAEIVLKPGNRGLYASLQPDLLISFGNSTISKNLKLYLREFKPRRHWHIQPAGHVANTYQTLTRVVRTKPDRFVKVISDWKTSEKQSAFYLQWKEANDSAKRHMQEFLTHAEFGELVATKRLIDCIPSKSNLHLANSMPVRLANLVGLKADQPDIEVFSNRGTGGIDGSNGAAVGMSMVSEKPVVLISGDMAFFYDRNAFWHNYELSNLVIIILNNHAGGIFGLIDGPSDQPELEEYFETEQKLTARHCAEEFGFSYLQAGDLSNLDEHLQNVFSDVRKPVLLEIETDKSANKRVFQAFKQLAIENFAASE